MADCEHPTLQFGRSSSSVFCPECDRVWFPRSRQDACDHKGYSFEKHGRCCFKCGVFMVDWGD